jgi:Holliday junction resolvase RusA-like endonuclease
MTSDERVLAIAALSLRLKRPDNVQVNTTCEDRSGEVAYFSTKRCTNFEKDIALLIHAAVLDQKMEGLR